MAKSNLIKLSEISTLPPKGFKKDALKDKTAKLVKRLGELQHLLYAEAKHSVLIVLQGMDASGKDGAVRRVFSECTIAGLDLASFKKPTEAEFAHDFLWRVHKCVPEKGTLTIFNRSHYEDILIQRVHGWIDMKRVQTRMAAINAFEDLLKHDNNTLIFKFYMHISSEEQEEQLRQRLEDPAKFWKHKEADWEERKLWDKYMEAYEYAINNSTTPWHICPVDKRWYRDYFIAKTLVEGLEKLDMQLPKPVQTQIKAKKKS
ncbi:MAG: polyphosphate kinase [Haliscomenobacteraceae bacterium CHB4]|nr:Polyphosphate:AMP/ADP phosphotransferase [Saprospiraceae bacterium]MCE7924639.1 polyphosphate kinase [Haliscomenobacteraceae bacterium CHB4]